MIPECPRNHGKMELRHEEDVYSGMKSEYFRCYVCNFSTTARCKECGEKTVHDMLDENSICMYCVELEQ